MCNKNYSNGGCLTCLFAQRDERNRYTGSCYGYSNCSYQEFKGKVDISEEEKDKKIVQLEKKLDESKNEIERIKRNWQISKTHQQKLYKNLKRQNKSKGIVNYPVTLDGCRIANEKQLLDFAKDFCQEKKYWQKQLAEKEKESSVLKAVIDKNKSGHFGAVHICNAISEFYEPLVKDMIIAELEKVKEFCKNSEGFNKYGQSVRVECVVDFIDCQIKDLRGENK